MGGKGCGLVTNTSHREHAGGPLGWRAPSCLIPPVGALKKSGALGPNKCPRDIFGVYGVDSEGAPIPRGKPTMFPINQGNESSNLLDHILQGTFGRYVWAPVHVHVLPWNLLCSLGILGDNLPINSNYIGLL